MINVQSLIGIVTDVDVDGREDNIKKNVGILCECQAEFQRKTGSLLRRRRFLRAAVNFRRISLYLGIGVS